MELNGRSRLVTMCPPYDPQVAHTIEELVEMQRDADAAHRPGPVNNRRPPASASRPT